MLTTRMAPTERKAVLSVSLIMSLRMIGLFMVLPLFTLYAQQLTGATPFLIGISVGIYGLSQALLQIPFGSLSDRVGRKSIICLGLMIFIVGSLIAGMTTSMNGMIIGRALQGAGAIGSTLLALLADLTHEEHRTKSMAMAGMTIGLSFSVAMLLGPLLTQWINVNQLFYLAALFGFLALLILFLWVPSPVTTRWHPETEPELTSFFSLLVEPRLAKLNVGIFILHVIFTASFIVIPINLYRFVSLSANQQWILYLPTLLVAFIISWGLMHLAEHRHRMKPYFLSGIFLFTISESLLWLAPSNLILTALGLCLFFIGFSLLEAFLPSLISRSAPPAKKGTALGIYSCAQFSGIFVGGFFGGWLYGQFSYTGIYLLCIILACVWLLLAYRLPLPHAFQQNSVHSRFHSSERTITINK